MSIQRTIKLLTNAIADTKFELENATHNEKQGLQDQLSDYKEDLRIARLRLKTEVIPAQAAAVGRSRLGAAAGRRRSRRRRRGRVTDTSCESTPSYPKYLAFENGEPIPEGLIFLPRQANTTKSLILNPYGSIVLFNDFGKESKDKTGESNQ